VEDEREYRAGPGYASLKLDKGSVERIFYIDAVKSSWGSWSSRSYDVWETKVSGGGGGGGGGGDARRWVLTMDLTSTRELPVRRSLPSMLAIRSPARSRSVNHAAPPTT
jgi:hypothetical protein